MIIPKEEVEKAAWESIEPPINLKTPEDSDGYNEYEVFLAFKAGVEFSEKYVQQHIQDIIIENQGLKLYKDNEAKRFKKLAVNFAYYCLMHDWLQNGFRCGGLSTEEIYDKFINDPNEANS